MSEKMSIDSGPKRVFSNRTNTVILRKEGEEDEDMASITKSFSNLSIIEKRFNHDQTNIF